MFKKRPIQPTQQIKKLNQTLNKAINQEKAVQAQTPAITPTQPSNITITRRTVTPEKYPIKETTEILVLIAQLANIADDILADGKVVSSELFKIVTALPKIPEAVKGADQIPKELGDLSPTEEARLKQDIAAELRLHSEQTEIIAELSLDIFLKFSRLVTEIKAAKQKNHSSL